MAKSYLVPSATQQDFTAFFGEVSRDFGTALPHILAERAGHQEPTIRWRPLLTENLHPQILVGYGDPAVFKDHDGYSAGRDVEQRARRVSRSSIRRTSGIGSPKGSSFQLEMSRHGRRKAATSPISGRRKWPGRAMNIGSPSPPGRHRTRSPSASPGALPRWVRGSTMARPWSPARRSTPPASASIPASRG